MSKTVINKHIATSTGGFTASDLQPGEIGINYQTRNEALAIKNTNNEIVPIGLNSITYEVTSGLHNTGNGTIDYTINLLSPPQFLSLFLITDAGNVTNVARTISLKINGTRFPVRVNRYYNDGSIVNPLAQAPWRSGTFISLRKLGSYYEVIGNPIVYEEISRKAFGTTGTNAYNYVFRRYANGWQEYYGQSYNYPSSVFEIPIAFEDAHKMFMTATLYGKSSKNTCIDTYTTKEVSVDFAYEQGGETKCGGLYVCGFGK